MTNCTKLKYSAYIPRTRKMTATKATSEEITLEEAVAQYLESLQSSNRPANTIAAYQTDLAQLVRFLQSSNLTSLGDVEPANLLEYFGSLKQSYSMSTLNRKAVSLKLFLGYLTQAGVSELQVPKDFPSFKVDKPPRMALTAEEVGHLFEVAALNCSSPTRLRNYAMLVLSYATGLKATELVSLSVEQVNLDKAYVYCRNSSWPERRVSFSEEVGAVIDYYITEGRPILVKGRDNGKLFLSETRGKQVTRAWLFAVLKEYGAQAGIHVNSTVLRNTFAFNIPNQDMSRLQFNELLGNHWSSVRNRYFTSSAVSTSP